MPLAEYLASEQAREDVRLVVAKPDDVLRYSGNGGPWLERTTLKAWTRLGIEGADQYITAYYRPDGDRYVVTDLGEGVRALRLKGVALLDIKPRVDAVMMAMWQEQTEFVAHYPAALIHGEVGTVNHPKADQLPDAICRVMLASLRVARVEIADNKEDAHA